MSVICCDSDGKQLEYLTQWDTNRIVKITGLNLSVAPAFHFFNANSKEAMVVSSRYVGTELVASIPNLILQEGLSIVLCLYEDDIATREGRTIYTVRIPVIPKPKPDDYTYLENIDYTSWTTLTNQAQAIIDNMQDVRFGVSDGYISVMTDGRNWVNLTPLSDLKGEPGTPGDKGDKGDRGTSILKVNSYPIANNNNGPFHLPKDVIESESGLEPNIGDIIEHSYFHYTIYSIYGNTVYFDNKVSIRGQIGDTGVSISEISEVNVTHTPGQFDTYRILMTDDSSFTFSVYNGMNGEGHGDMLSSVYDTHNKATDVFDYVDKKVNDVSELIKTSLDVSDFTETTPNATSTTTDDSITVYPTSLNTWEGVLSELVVEDGVKYKFSAHVSVPDNMAAAIQVLNSSETAKLSDSSVVTGEADLSIIFVGDPDEHHYLGLLSKTSSTGSAGVTFSNVEFSEISAVDNVARDIANSKLDANSPASQITQELVNKLISVEQGANKYVLPTASTSVLGGVKVGAGLGIDENGVLYLALEQAEGRSF